MNWLRDLIDSVGRKDNASHGAHFVLAMAGSIVPAVLVAAFSGPVAGLVVGFLASEIWLGFFVRKETLDWERHQLAGDDLKRWGRDGLLDLVGPVGGHALWWIGLLWKLWGTP